MLSHFLSLADWRKQCRRTGSNPSNDDNYMERNNLMNTCGSAKTKLNCAKMEHKTLV